MSKYKRIATQITNPDHICRALDDLAVAYEVAEVAHRELTLLDWRNRPTALTGAVVVRNKHLGGYSNDLGWSLDLETGTYVAQIDHQDDASQRILNGVNQRCALLKLQDLATLNGFSLEVTEDEQNVQRILIGGLQ